MNFSDCIQYSRHRIEPSCRPALALAAICWLVVAGALNAENWDRFRGPNGAGQSDAAGIPAEWQSVHFLWKNPLPGIGHSSPVVWGDKLFLTSPDPKTGQPIVLAYDALSGRKLWDRHVAPAVSTYKHHDYNSLASSTPALDARHVFVTWLTDGKVMIAALRHNGEDAWRREVGPYKEAHGFGNSPIVVDGLVCVATDSEADSAIAAFDASTGEPRWRVPREAGTTSFATPCLLDPAARQKLLLNISTASGLTAINAQTGHVAWQTFQDDLPQRCVGSPLVERDMVFVACGQGGTGKWLIAARSTDSSRPPQEVYRIEQGAPYVPTPVVAGDLLFLWHDRGVVSCHDLTTGRPFWKERIGGDYHSSPLRIGNRIFGISMKGEVVVLAADRQFKLLARNALEEPCHATPAVAHGRLYLRTESSLICIGEPSVAKVN